MVGQRIAGRGFSAIAAGLTEIGVPTSRGKSEWRATAVQKILTSPLLLGYQTEVKNGVTVVRRGKDGQPVMFTDDPLIDRDEWDLLQQAIRAGSKARGLPQSRHLLYRVLFCRECSPEPFDPGTAVLMYGNRRHTGAGTYGHAKDHREYYNCKSCRLNIRLDRVEPLVEALVLHEAGNRVLLERRIIPGDDHSAALSRLERAAERRRELLADDPEDEDMVRSLAAMEAQIDELRRRPHEPDQAEWREVASGITVAAHWDSLDTGERAKFLRDWEVTALADREGMSVRLGWLEIYSETFKLTENRLVPASLPALITHSRDWQRVSGAVLPAVAAHQLQA